MAASVTPACRRHHEAYQRFGNQVEVWLPPAQAWNRKFMAVGNGGQAGKIDIANIQDTQYVIVDGSIFVDLERDATTSFHA